MTTKQDKDSAIEYLRKTLGVERADTLLNLFEQMKSLNWSKELRTTILEAAFFEMTEPDTRNRIVMVIL